MRLYFSLTNLEPLVISQSSASTNSHQCLDHIPGSAILGAIASKLYSSLSDEQSFALFHSGACRFGPAYPMHHDEIAMPIPASWYKIKNDGHTLYNHAAANFSRDKEKQYQQCRNGYITSKNIDVLVKQGLTTRTAIDEQTQRASDGQLYSYAFIEAGQHFGAWVDVNDSSLLAILRPLLNGELSIGRSRSSEFGRVQLHCPTQQPATKQACKLEKKLVIWCLSDAECRDAWGMPTVTPRAEDLHPALKGELDTTRSFIRSHKVRRFNRARNGFDTEQQLISRGSILTFTLQETASDDILTEMASQGIGCNRQQGLGWVSANPQWASMAQPNSLAIFDAITLTPPPKQETSGAQTETPLLRWIRVKQQESHTDKKQSTDIKALHKEIFAAYRNARHYRNVPRNYQAGPSSSQWHRLTDLVRSRQDESWFKVAFVGDAAICKSNNDPDGWGIDWQEQGVLLTFSEKMKKIFDGADILLMRQILEILCRYDLSTSDGLQRFHKNHLEPHEGGE
ncbi:hypothetical protein [Shewanella baltica]|uniref:hypothetical protein n=1 Tax=Shewanella baltica TaxID=62322 RepID=UPI000E0183FB|nr:hypothetical protein [Shewanella baltica]SUI57298.1 CRISPR-associated RAMP protein, Csx10 family [Shewanella baltica]